MNTTEAIVESYFRQHRDCLTHVDVKVQNGFGRQLDILAYNNKTKEQFHIEVSVKHDRSFCMNISQTKEKIREKFFGSEKNSVNSKYLASIKKTYERYGFDYQKVIRVWVTWEVMKCDSPEKQTNEAFQIIAKKHGIKYPKFELILFKDKLLPELISSVGTQNYEDFNIRAISLIAMADRQNKKGGKR